MEDERTRADNRIWLGILAITLVAFALRVYRLDFVSLRGDEAFTVIFVQRTWEGLWKGISTIEPNPPLMYLALRAWVAIAGASEFATRYFSVFFGVLSVPVLYRLARSVIASTFAPLSVNSAKQSPSNLEIASSHPSTPLRSAQDAPRNDIVALIAAALIAINPYQVWHSQDVRNYTMWPLLSLLALIFLWRWWKSEISDFRFQISDLIFYVLATLASLYTHYYDTFILVAENIFVLAFVLFARHWQTLARWIGAQAVIVLLYAPWVLFGTNRITTYGEASAESGASLLDVFSRTLASFTVSDTVPGDFKAALWFPLAFALIAILLLLARRNRALAAFLFLWIAIPTFAQYAVSIGRPLFLERYLNGIAPAYYLIFAIGLAQVSSFRFQVQGSRLTCSHVTDYASRITLALGFLFFVFSSAYALSNYYFNPTYSKSPDWRALMQHIKDRRAPGDFVIQNFTEMSAIYYRGDLPVLTVPQNYWATAADEKLLRQLNADYRRIWFIPASPGWWDNDRFVEKFLARTDERVSETPIDIFRLQLYLTPHEFESKIIPLNARVGNATLAGYRIEGTRNLHLVLYWRANQKIEKDFSVFAHVADANGNVIAQHDGAPAFGLHPTTAWQPGESIVDVHGIKVDATSGTYTLLVGMYDPNSLARVAVFDANGTRAPNDQVSLTQITIAQ
ncbi:MAG: hypothetical protein L0Y55_10170 [Anaerolineales bacterium]|nr:hypothetical protein [Anaerolineales bacterium]